MPKKCETCKSKNASIVRPKTGKYICQECFFTAFEEEIYYAISSTNVFKKGEKIAICASGGKDSSVLAHIMVYLNQKYNLQLDLFLLSVDEGIKGYRDGSLETVKQNAILLKIPLKIVSFKELFGWTMDEIAKKVGFSNLCTYCGVFRRQSLDRGSLMMGAKKMVTGHNADDIAETVLMNILRGDSFRLPKCVDISTGMEDDNFNEQADDFDHIHRIKPFKYTYEKEIVLYAYHKKILYFTTECFYYPQAYRGNVRELIKNLELVRSSSIIDIIHSAEQIQIGKCQKQPKKLECKKCKFVSSNELCKACILVEKLNGSAQKIHLQLDEPDHIKKSK